MLHGGDSLADVGDGIHPAAHAHFIPHIWGIAELVDDADVIWVRSTEQLPLQGQGIHLGQERAGQMADPESGDLGTRNGLQNQTKCMTGK